MEGGGASGGLPQAGDGHGPGAGSGEIAGVNAKALGPGGSGGALIAARAGPPAGAPEEGQNVGDSAGVAGAEGAVAVSSGNLLFHRPVDGGGEGGGSRHVGKAGLTGSGGAGNFHQEHAFRTIAVKVYEINAGLGQRGGGVAGQGRRPVGYYIRIGVVVGNADNRWIFVRIVNFQLAVKAYRILRFRFVNSACRDILHSANGDVKAGVTDIRANGAHAGANVNISRIMGFGINLNADF